MKNKNKVLMGMAAVSISVVALANAHFANKSESSLSALNMANVEALADGESGGGNYNLCRSESKVRAGYTYYDCGSCAKVYDEQGKGATSKCFL